MLLYVNIQESEIDRSLTPEKQILIEPIFAQWIQSAHGKTSYGFDILLSSTNGPAFNAGRSIWLPGWLNAKQASTLTSNTGYMSGIEPLTGTNFSTWRDQVKLTLGVMDLYHTLCIDPLAALTAESTADQKCAYEQRERSNRMSLMIIKNSISVAIPGAIPDSENAKEYSSSVEEQFKGTSKAHASTLILKMLTTKYDEGFRTIRRLEKNQRTIKVENGVDLKVEAIGTLSLILEGGFCLNLYGTLYVPSMTRNLISVSKLIIDDFIFSLDTINTKIVETRHIEFLENANNSGSGSFRRIELQEARDETPIIHVPIPIKASLDTLNYQFIAQDHLNNVEETESNPELNVEHKKLNSCCAGRPISWKSKKQVLTTTSTMMAEYVSVYNAIFHSMFLRNLITGLKIINSISRPLKIYCDNSAVVSFSNSNSSTGAGLYLDTKYLFVRERVEEQRINIEHIRTHEMLADPLTKARRVVRRQSEKRLGRRYFSSKRVVRRLERSLVKIEREYFMGERACAESRRNVPEWLLRIGNDRVAWNKYPWGSYVWPTLYSQLWNANVRRWGPLYVDQPTNEDDMTTYSIFGYTWTFKFVEQKIELERNKKDVDDIKEQMLKFKEEMNVRSVRQENTVPINVGQHYGFSDFSQFQSMQVPSHIGMPNLQTTIETQHDVVGLVDQNIPNRGKRQQLSSKYLVTPFTAKPPTTMVPKQRVSKNKNKGKKANLSPMNLGGVLEGYNEEDNNVTFFGSHFTSNILFYENVDPAKDPHVIGTLDGFMRPYPSWNDVDWVFLPIHVARNHWATGVIHLANSHFY
nr:putative zinc finger, CCHC-type [Tanacetum cinerariifolium]